MPRSGPKRRSVILRFWDKVDQPYVGHGCWQWLAGKDKDGYGNLALPGRRGGSIRAHRFSWVLHYGSIPEGMLVLHKCDNPSCVNPVHLFLGTYHDNYHDMKTKKRWRPGGCRPGEDHPLAKLCEKDVKRIRSSKLSGPELARQLGVRKQTISSVRRKETWKHIA